MKTILFNPFKRYDADVLLPVGLVSTVIGSLLAWLFNTSFNGVIDVHASAGIIFWQPFLENLINVGCLLLFLLLIGKYLNAKTRFIDILAICLLSRTPLYILPFLNTGDYMTRASEQLMLDISHQAATYHPVMITVLVLFGVITILAIIWYIALLYNGFKVAAHARGTRSVIFFILALLAAEVLSYILIFNIETLLL